MFRQAVLGGAALALASLSGVGAAQAQLPTAPDYARPESWICRPGRKDACAIDLAIDRVGAGGKRQRLAAVRGPAPKIDCFYVYPTISEASGISAPIAVTPAEQRVVKTQLAQLGSVCRLYAPLYRQLTLADMKLRAAGQETPRGAAAAAEADVAAAWRHYLEHDNQGRGVVLIGHSQGAVILQPMIARQIEGTPVQSRLVSVVIPGSFVLVPTGKAVGGTFKSIPPCRAPGQIGCVVVFNSYGPEGPPEGFPSRFGDQEAVCTNPAALVGGRGRLKPRLAANGDTIIPPFTVTGPLWTRLQARARAAYLEPAEPLWAECRDDEHGIYLRMTDAAGGWTLGGAWLQEGVPQPAMGLHLIDLDLTMGNLVDLIGEQAKAYEARARP